MWEDSSSEKEELANLVMTLASKTRTPPDRMIREVWKMRMGTMCPNLVKLRSDIYTRKGNAPMSTQSRNLMNLDLEARMDRMEPLVKEHFDEEPDRAMTRSEWEAT